MQGGPPPEKQITLAGIQGPRLGRRDGGAKDEPFAWAAREFVRTAFVGKPCTFEIEEGTQTRTFGHINVGGENLASKIVAAGWAKVKTLGGNANASKGAYIEELLQVCGRCARMRAWRERAHPARAHLARAQAKHSLE